ncbi:MAG: hypothetical protein AAF471_08980, partial [Myxococcota bacterium]
QDGAQASEVFFLIVQEETDSPTIASAPPSLGSTAGPLAVDTTPSSTDQGSGFGSAAPGSDNNLLLGLLGGLSAGLSVALCSVGACWYKHRQGGQQSYHQPEEPAPEENEIQDDGRTHNPLATTQTQQQLELVGDQEESDGDDADSWLRNR